MNQSDLSTLRDRLTELAEAMSVKPPSEGGIKAWLVALRDLPLEHVLDQLDFWLRTRAKMPTPADVRQLTQKAVESEQARIQREHSPAAGATQSTPDSPAYRAFLTWWDRFKRNPPPCPHPDRIGTFRRAGAVLSNTSFKRGDFEALEERRAIQAEGGPL